jgi:small GTP-binding protein
MKDAFSSGKHFKGVQSHDYYKYKISYTIKEESNLIFLFVTGLTDSVESIKKELLRCKREFLNLFEDILEHRFDAKTFEVFHPTIDSIHRNLRPKISLVGFSGVGKTTITKLIKAEEIPMRHVPTITGDIATIKIGKLHFHLWDFAGQEQFSYLWTNFVKGSDAVLLITDSTLENIEKSKFFLELIKEQAPHAHTAVIGNKQDLPDAMKSEQIEKILSLKTYSMIANKKENRDKMIQIIADILEMSAEISPLLKPLLERDKLTEEAMNALENAEFNEAAMIFEKISDLCLDLGDDSLGSEFYKKSQKIKEMLTKVGAPQQPVEPEPIPPPAIKPQKPSAPEPKPPLPPPKPQKPSAPEPMPPPTLKPQKSIEPEPMPPLTPNIFEELDALQTVQEQKVVKEPIMSKATEKSKAPTIFEQLDFLEIPKELQDPTAIKTQKVAKKKKKPKKKKAKALKKKKKKKLKKKEQYEESEAPMISSVIQKPSFLIKPEGPKIQKTPEKPKTLEKPAPPKEKPSMDEWMPPGLKPAQKKELPKAFLEAMKAEEEEEKMLIKPVFKQNKMGLDLNPEDFIIKQRPKMVIAVPKDAKKKLKISSYGHVVNPDQVKPQIKAPIAPIKPKSKISMPVSPIKLMEKESFNNLAKPKIPAASVIPKKPVKLEIPVVPKPKAPTVHEEAEEPSIIMEAELLKADETISSQQKKNLEDSLMDLKIKKAKIQRMSLDFDMQELTGEITTEQFNEKKKKLEMLEKKIEEQIQQLQSYLNNLTS